MIEQPVIIPTHEDHIVADLHIGSDDAAIILPGWSGTRYGPQRILLQTAHALAEQGLTTLRIDFHGRGDSPGSEEATLDGMIDDAVAAARWLMAEQGVKRVNFIGLCSGGNVALGAASLLPEATTGVICWSLLPFMEHKAKAARQGTPRATMLKQMARKMFRLETWKKLLRGEANVRGAMNTLAKDKEGDAGEKARKTSARDILGELKGFQGRLGLIYGELDPESAGSEAFFTAWCKQHGITCDTARIAGAPHNYYTAHWTSEVVAQTSAWLTR